MSSLAFLRKAAITLSEIGSGLKSPQDLISGDHGTPYQRRPRDTFFHRVLVIHLRIHFLALVGGEKFDELDRVALIAGRSSQVPENRAGAFLTQKGTFST
jgi:hypothetical protein